MSINPATKITLRSKATIIKGLIIIISALIAAYILINESGLRRISRINLIKIKSKIEEEMPQKKEEIKVTGQVREEEEIEEKIREENKFEIKITSTTTTKVTTLKAKEVNNEDQLIEIAKIWRVEQDNLTLCPEIPPNQKGKIDVDMRSLKLEEIEEEYKYLWPGGHWRPKECKSRQKVAIVVPYRNREPHLRTFLHNIHRFLQKQQLDYAIFVVEQIGDFAFNKGRLTNIGVLEALRVYPFDCIIFNDVDTYPENDNLLYRCSTDPKYTKHLSVYLERGEYKELYADFVGGVLALTVEQLRKINGYSNDFWGWGGEDDDLNTRVKLANMSFQRNKTEISRFRTFKHGTDHGNDPHPCRFKLIGLTKQKYLTDGFSNLNYRVESINYGKLYTHIKADVFEEEYNKWKEYIKTIGC
uniref:Beta-1,4-N-acetylgalactosaminyltransferase n=1 Tax=Meloidogyne floridensis TaxID=298350 RepID=A0A915PAK4_9BILA